MAAGDDCGIGNEHSAAGATVHGTGATTVEEAGPADCVYIAGNPDLYPIEYYDSEQQCYRGILPELLGMVAEDTGSPLPM